MATTTKTREYDGVRGGWYETGQFTVTPGVISQQSEKEVAADATLTCAVGDQLFVNAQNLTGGEICKGARITATNTAKVLLANYLTSTNVTDSTATTYDYLLIHLS